VTFAGCECSISPAGKAELLESSRRGARVVGIDISHALLDKAWAEYEEPLGVTCLSVDATSPRALEREVFDGVACNHGLADIDNLDATLATVARVLRPGGWCRLFHASPVLPRLGNGSPETRDSAAGSGPTTE